MTGQAKTNTALRFEEHRYVEFFGVVSAFDEDAYSYSYTLERDGLRLLFTVFPLDGGVYTSLYRDGITEPIAKSRLDDCTHARFVAHGSRTCLEIGRPEHPTSEPTAPLIWGLRLFIEPHFSLEFIHEVTQPCDATCILAGLNYPVRTTLAGARSTMQRRRDLVRNSRFFRLISLVSTWQIELHRSDEINRAHFRSSPLQPCVSCFPGSGHSA